MLQLHPHRAFLNTEVTLTNDDDIDLMVSDSLTGKSFTIPAHGVETARFTEGLHTFEYRSASGETHNEHLVVEDAYKFGGSQRKGAFIFDEIPWVVLVMKDRTYFYNKDTREQFVEHNLSPDRVEFLSPGFLLFSSSHDFSFFSLDTMSIEHTFLANELVFHNEYCCVLSTEKGILVYLFKYEGNGERFRLFDCESFSTFETRVFLKLEGITKSIKILHLPEEPGYSFDSALEDRKIDHPFFSFLEKNQLVCGDSPSELYGVVLGVSKNYSDLIYKRSVPVSFINGHEIWHNGMLDKLTDPDSKDYYTAVVSLQIKRIGWKYYRVEDTESIQRINGRYPTRSHSYSIIKDVNTMVEHSEDEPVTVLSADNHLFLTYGGTTISVSEKGNQTIRVTAHVSDSGFAVFQQGKTLMLPNNKVVFRESSLGNAFRDYGLIEGYLDSRDKKVFYWCKTDEYYPGKHLTDKNGIPFLSGSEEVKYFTPGGEVLPAPAPLDEITAISGSGMSVLLEEGAFFRFSTYKDGHWEHSEKTVIDIYDRLNVKDAVFCENGKNFVYQKEDGTLVFHSITDDTENYFPEVQAIKKSLNGFRPYLSLDSYSKPVIVDPFTKQRVDGDFLRQYRFSNIDGSVYLDKRIIRYYLRLEGSRMIDKKDYLEYKSQYDSLEPDGDLIEKRKNYVRLHDPEYYSRINPVTFILPSFVDSFLVNKKEFLVFNKKGKTIEVEIGSPLTYLNYVSFSVDSSRVLIAGKYKDAKGVCKVYDMESQDLIYDNNRISAVWMGLFNRSGEAVFYEGNHNGSHIPYTYFLDETCKDSTIVENRSLLTISPSGRLVAMSKQGYSPYVENPDSWGHTPSCDLYIACMDKPDEVLAHFNDHGDQIKGVATAAETVASVSFSSDEKRLLSVSNDGVVVIRNLHFELD